MYNLIKFIAEIVSNKKIDLSSLIKVLFAILTPFGFVFIIHFDKFSNIRVHTLFFLIVLSAIIFLFVYSFYLGIRIKITTNITQKQAPKFIESNDKLTIMENEMRRIVANYNESFIQEKNILRKNYYRLCQKLYGKLLVKLDKLKIGIENLDKKINNSNANQNIIEYFNFRNLSSIENFDFLLIITIIFFIIISYIQDYKTTIPETIFSFVSIFIILLALQTLKQKLKYWRLIFLMPIYEYFVSKAIVNFKKQNFKLNEKTKL